MAQNQWPSQQSRDQMLAAKFTGAATVSSFTLGAVRSGARWTSPEDPDASVTGAYAVPVELGFADPGAMQPVEVSTDYQAAQMVIARTQIWVAPQTLRDGAVGWALLVVGEGPASLDAPIINPASPTTYTASVPILMYHLVGPPPVRNDYTSEYSYHLDYELTVPPAQFQAEVSYLVERGYASISLTRLFDHLDYGLPLPAETVVLTFDDGFINEYQDAVPILKAAGYTGVFFPCSGLIGVTNGAEQYMTSGDLATLSSEGFQVEDHTYNDATSLWGRNPAEIDRLAGSTASLLEAITNAPIQFIAYSGLWPYKSGTQVGPGETELFSELGPLGYVGGLEDDWLPGAPWHESATQPWELPRIRAYPGEQANVFAAVLQEG